METVEVVIRIPKKQLERLQKIANGTWGLMNLNNSTEIAILNGTVLPKGHDALLDAGQLMDYCHNQIEGHKYVDCNVIARFPCVVKADRGDDNG